MAGSCSSAPAPCRASEVVTRGASLEVARAGGTYGADQQSPLLRRHRRGRRRAAARAGRRARRQRPAPPARRARRHHRGAAGPRPPGHGPRHAARPGPAGADPGRSAFRCASSLPARTSVVPRLAELRALAQDPRAELLVAGRGSARTLAWLERRTACRIRFLAEERGLRTAPPGQRPARTTLGRLLDLRGPDALAAIVAELADGAVLDSRVLLADRFGRDEGGWPSPEDRFASRPPAARTRSPTRGCGR